MQPRATAIDELDVRSLVARALDGDEDAWATIVVRYQRVVWKAVRMATSDPTLQEEAFAATLAALARGLAGVRDPAYLPGWLARTAVNEVRTGARGTARNRTVPIRDDDGERFVTSDPAADPGAGLERSDTCRLVRAAVERLDDRCRRLITLLILGDGPISYEEAAAKLQRPVGSLGPSRARCLDKLRDDPELRTAMREGAL